MTYTWADLNIPEASMLADLTGIAYDFRTAHDLSKKLLAETMDKSDFSFSEPYSIAIAVIYSRPFTSGIRHRLGKTDLAILTPSQREFHQYIYKYRDKHVAHSVNSFEENHPRANYCEERVQQEGITSISCLSTRIIGLSASDLESVVELTTVFGKHIDVLIKREEERVLPIVRGMPLDQILKAGRNAFSGGARSAVGEDRKKLAGRKGRRRSH